MAARIEVIRMRDRLAFAPLLATVGGKYVLVVVVVEVLVLVNVRLGHSLRRFRFSLGVTLVEGQSRRDDAVCAKIVNARVVRWLDREDRFDTGRAAFADPDLYTTRGAARPAHACPCAFRARSPETIQQGFLAGFFAGDGLCNIL